jgi:Arc/MetJ-type ribon-helix-helix transcriptional regulator
MNLSLEPDVLQRIEALMKRCGFASPQEVIRYALDTLDEHERADPHAAKDLEALYPGYREMIDRGIAEADAGMVTDGEDFFRDLEHRDVTKTKDGRKTA